RGTSPGPTTCSPRPRGRGAPRGRTGTRSWSSASRPRGRRTGRWGSLTRCG
ncbi:unnamed protein product, partial [Heterosigma akashiwo]